MTNRNSQTNITMKDSGIEWIGKIPNKWNVYPGLKYFSISKNKVEEGELKPLSVGYMGVVPQLENAAKNISEGDRKHVLPNDIILNSRSDRMGAVGLSKYEGGVSLVYHVWRPKTDEINPRYYHHLYRNVMFSQEYYRYGNGIVDDLWSTKDFALKRIKIPVPTTETQKRIADFLDEKTEKIDQLIQKKQKLIELLKELRASVITKAVTKGLDPNAKMKDSGIEWIGKIPEGWEISPFKHVIEFQEGPGIMAEDFVTEGVPLLRVKNLLNGKVVLEGCNYLEPQKVSKKWDHYKLKINDILISCSATTGTAAEVSIDSEGAIAYTGLIRLWPKFSNKITKDFIRYLTISYYYTEQIDLLKTGTAMQHYGPSHLRRVIIVLPTISEVEAITKYLDAKTQKMHQIIMNVEEQIKKLKEYRASLIYNAVTGKIEV